MKKPTKEDFGYIPGAGWIDQDEMNKYVDAVCAWEIRPRKSGGRPRNDQRPIHESWNKVLQLFDSTNPQRSQGAFCRYVNQEPATKGYWKNGLTPAMLSQAKTKPITEQMYAWIHRWDYDATKEVENG